jgi:hypothetical protein
VTRLCLTGIGILYRVTLYQLPRFCEPFVALPPEAAGLFAAGRRDRARRARR